MDLIIKPTKINNQEINAVSAKDLYISLGLNNAHWSRWYPVNIIENEYFTEHKDWIGFAMMVNGNETKDFMISIDFAKHIAMMARTDKSHDLRNYFIECENKQQPKLPQSFAEALQLAADQAKQLELQAPKVQAFDALIGADTIFSMNQTAKLLGWGRNKLFTELRKRSVLMDNNLPYQQHIENGRFVVKDTPIQRSIGTMVVSQTYVTTKGQVWLNELLGVR